MTFASVGLLAVVGGSWTARANQAGRTAALLATGRVARALQRSSIAAIWLRRGLGCVVLASVGTISLGLDQSSLAGISWASTDRLEQALLARVQPARPDDERIAAASGLPLLGTLPPYPKGVVWLNSPPLSRDQVWGKVVVVNVWTYSCINCVRTLPHAQAGGDVSGGDR